MVHGTKVIVNAETKSFEYTHKCEAITFLGNITIRDAMSTIGGPFCYVYA